MQLPFDAEELVVILEAARLGMADADNFEMLGENMDLSDRELCEIREKLQKFMDND